MSVPILYRRVASPPSNAVVMLADIIGLQLQYKEPDILRLEHKSPEFKKINPMGTIPVLNDNGFILSESHAIMKYLLDANGGPHKERLYPSDAKTRSLVDQCMYFDAGVMFIRLKVVALPTLLLGLTGPTPEHLKDIEDAYEVLEGYLQGRKYIACDHLTLADLSVGSTTASLQAMHKLDSTSYPKSSEWFARLHEEACFKNIMVNGTAHFTELMNIFWAKNKKKAALK